MERHHLFPRKYLEGRGVTGPGRINQIANMSYVEWPENIEISATSPAEYWPKYMEQFTQEDMFAHALPTGWHTMEYDEFLEERRSLMARVIRKGFETIGATPEGEAIADLPPLIVKVMPDTYLHPAAPYSNVLALKKIVRNLTGDVLWYEQHMPEKVLELLTEELSVESIDAVRLMSGPANITAKAKKSFGRFRDEFEAQGLYVEWRVLASGDARVLHARVIADDDHTYELPPLNSILAGTVDSIRASEIPLDAFTDAWERGESLESYQPMS